MGYLIKEGLLADAKVKSFTVELCSILNYSQRFHLSTFQLLPLSISLKMFAKFFANYEERTFEPSNYFKSLPKECLFRVDWKAGNWQKSLKIGFLKGDFEYFLSKLLDSKIYFRKKWLEHAFL